jgi:hypothetical protein
MRAATSNLLISLVSFAAQLKPLQDHWLRGIEFDEHLLEELHLRATATMHALYLETIPCYAKLADELGLSEEASPDHIWDNMLFSEGLFKSYDPALLVQCDFDAMTVWLRNVSHCGAIQSSGATTLTEWIDSCASQGVQIDTSSGTTGQPSIVPRDEMTLALAAGLAKDFFEKSCLAPDLSISDYNALLVTPRVGYTGLSRFSREIARLAKSAEHAFEARSEFVTSPAWARVMSWLDDKARTIEPTLIVATPFTAAMLCREIQKAGRRPTLPKGSRLLIGGGWKTFAGQALDFDELCALVQGELGIRRGNVIDSYSMIECNASMSRCVYNRYHVPPQLRPFVLDEAFKPLPLPAIGRFGFSDPLQVTFPGFFATSDIVSLTNLPCDCGRLGYSIVGSVQRAASIPPRGCAGAFYNLMGFRRQ